MPLPSSGRRRAGGRNLFVPIDTWPFKAFGPAFWFKKNLSYVQQV